MTATANEIEIETAKERQYPTTWGRAVAIAPGTAVDRPKTQHTPGNDKANAIQLEHGVTIV